MQGQDEWGINQSAGSFDSAMLVQQEHALYLDYIE
jgi:hypothetical protein